MVKDQLVLSSAGHGMAYNYDRSAASGALSSKQFAEIIQRADIKDRQLYIKPRSIGSSNLMFINLYNIPKGIGGGADNENNRQMYMVSGFDRQSEDTPTEKVKLELSVNMLPRDKAFRARSGKPAAIAAFLVSHIEKMVREAEVVLPIRMR